MSEVYNLDLDEELLAHLPDPQAWIYLRGEGFRDELIVDDEIREIYLWAEEHLRDHGQPATASVLADEFDLVFADPLTAIGDLLDRMRMRYMRNQGKGVLKDIGKQWEDDPLKIPKLLLQEGRQLTDLLTRRGDMYGTGDFDRAQQHYYDKAVKGKGPSIGFRDVDDYFYGQRGVTIILGPPKTWKSWFMVKGTIENVWEGGFPYLYSLELPAEETDMRLRCMMADIPWHKYLKDNLSRDELKLIGEASEQLDAHGIYRVPKPPPGERSIHDLVQRAGDAGATAIFIDQLQYVETDGRSLGAWNEPGRYWEVLNQARTYSDTVPICFAHQFNRSVMRAEEMPRVEQAKGSQGIEEIATLCLGLWASPDMRKSHLCQLGTLVSRNYNLRNWEVAIDLTYRCSFEITRVIDDD